MIDTPRPRTDSDTDTDEMRRALPLLFDPDGTHEIRFIPTKEAGNPEHAEPMAASLETLDQAVARIESLAIRKRRGSIYYTLNPGAGRPAFSDDNITRRRWILIDVDPVKAPGHRDDSATDNEHDQALVWAGEIADHLTALGWPAPVLIDSGNGAHLLYRVDLPNDAEARELVRGVLQALKAIWAAVDANVFNASRVAKLPGTWARKGADTPDRPHRLCRILAAPEAAEVVPAELLQALGQPPGDGAEAAPGARPRSVDDQAWTVRAGAGRLPTWIRRTIESEAGRVAMAPEGGRNDTLNRAAFRMGQLEWLGLDPREARSMLLHAAIRAGLSEAEAGPTIDRGLAKGQEQPRPAPVFEDRPAEHRRSTAEPEPEHDQAEAHEGDRAAEPEPGAATEPDDRPTIYITTEIDVVADRAVELLAKDPNVYQRGRALVHVVRDANRRRKRDATRPTGTPAIMPMTAANVLDRLCRAARWCKLKPTKDGSYEAVPAVLPENVVKAVLERRHWPDIRPLEGVVEAPTLRPDGSVLDRPGWDPETGLLFEPGQRFPAISDRPTRAQARAAAELLLDLVTDFPFKAGHRAAFLAAALTPLARFAIDGPTPLFLFDANVPGAGKSMLADIIAIIATLRAMARSAYPEKDEEVRKLILSIALAGDRMLLFDNVATGFSIGGAALDGALTATVVKDRILGQSQMSGDVPWNCVLFATGNNLGLRGDALRRVVPCRLESPEVNPEERTEFRHPGLLGYVREHRGELVAAGLTILRAYVVAGRPEPEAKLPSMDFRAWAGLIRHAIHWAIGEDPCAGRAELKENDAETVALHGLVAGWAELCKFYPRGLTTGAAMRILAEDRPELAALRAIVAEWSTDGGLPSAYTVGRRLSKARGRMTPAGALGFEVFEGNKLWRVTERPDAPGTATVGGDGDFGGLSTGHAGESSSECSSKGRQTSPPKSSSPPEPSDPWVMKARGSAPRPAAAFVDDWEEVA